MQKTFISVLPGKIHAISLRMNCEFAQSKTVKHKKISTGEVSKQNWVALSKENKNNVDGKGDTMTSENGLQLLKVTTTPVNRHLL